MSIEWTSLEDEKPTSPVIVTSEFYPGWFELGMCVLGEWRKGYHQAGDLMKYEPTHWSYCTPVPKRKFT